jgi:hypothetical protein
MQLSPANGDGRWALFQKIMHIPKYAYTEDANKQVLLYSVLVGIKSKLIFLAIISLSYYVYLTTFIDQVILHLEIKCIDADIQMQKSIKDFNIC